MIYLNLIMSIWFFLVVIAGQCASTESKIIVKLPALIFGVITMFLFFKDMGFFI